MAYVGNIYVQQTRKVLLVMASLTTKFNELSLVLVNGFASAAVVCLLCKHRKERTHEQIDRNHPG